MKAWNWWKLSAGVLITLVPLAGWALEPDSVSAPLAPTAQSALQPESEPAEPAVGPVDTLTTNSVIDIDDAPAKSINNEKPLPQHLRLGGPVSEVIKLANSGLDQSVMLAFVTNSTATFNLGAEDIIYLNDIGVPSPVVTAMIQRDQQLRNAGAAWVNSATTPPNGLAAAEPGIGTPPSMEPTPDQVAPQPMEPSGPVPEGPPPGAEVASDASFYDSLSPYGSWVDLGGYGWCWQPTVVGINPYWQPYYDCGHWVYSTCGWYWSSSYTWGWAPFHYGRWFRHHRLGWCWRPDTVWGPSWVSWRYGDHFCGWAPLPPGTHFTAGVGLTFHGRPVREYEDCGLRSTHYRFVTWDHFQDRQLGDYRLPPNQAAWAYNNSTVITRINGDGHTIINHGVPPTRVAAATGAPVPTVSLREVHGASPRSGAMEHYDASGRSLEVYRPHLAPTTPSRTPAMGKRAEISPAGSGRLTAASPWLNQQTFATVTPGRIPEAGAVTSDNPAQQRVAEQPLILRGSQSSALREPAPPSSLIIIGRKDANGRPLPSLSVPQTQARSATRNDETALADPRSRAGQDNSDRAAEARTVQRNLPWLAQQEQRTVPVDEPGPAYSPEARRYQAPTWPAPQEVPRYAPSPSYVPQRSYSAPAPARTPEYRSTPSAASAPAAARSQPSSASSSASGRNSR